MSYPTYNLYQKPGRINKPQTNTGGEILFLSVSFSSIVTISLHCIGPTCSRYRPEMEVGGAVVSLSFIEPLSFKNAYVSS